MAAYAPSLKTTEVSAVETKKRLDESVAPMMKLEWYHPNLTRHAADCMLIDNAPEGSYLLRRSSNYEGDGSYVLSVKLSSSVQHIKVERTASGFKFGNITFQTVEAFRKHFEVERPVIGGDSGITVVLKFPYPRMVDESHVYTDVVHHAVTNMIDSTSESEVETSFAENNVVSPTLLRSPIQAISSKEGYLTKQGRIIKNWKIRWFVLRNNTLNYYKNKRRRYPIDRLDLRFVRTVEYDNSKQKDYCFRVEFPRRTYFFHASCAEDCQQWVELLRSKISAELPVT